MTPLDPVAGAQLRARLLAWYGAEARDLPWRRTRDPYAIWVSEAMLQQTRVETVEGYWRRFLEAFPTVADLAAAEEDRVLTLWSGLGYYRRARSLRAAAQAMVAQHGGEFPRSYEEALALPGVGPYTAAAVLSIAFDLPVALVDGNVERVLARQFLIEDPVASGGLKRATRELTEALLPATGAGTWNQALMELGATVCTPRSPRCGECPIAEPCAARAAGRAQDLPVPRAKPAPIDVQLDLAWILGREGLLLERRPPKGRMAGMWQLPTREVTGSDLFPGAWSAPLELADGLADLRHAITRHRIRARVRRGRAPEAMAEAWRWFPLARLGELPLTGMTKKALRVLQPETRPVESS